VFIKKIGIYGIYIALFITTVLFLFSKPYLSLVLETPYLSLGQYFALLGATLLALTFCLTTNTKFLEDIFGGLDKVYKVHQKLGKWGFSILLLHPVFIMTDALVGGIPFTDYLALFLTKPYLAGTAALTLLTVLILITIYAKLSYETWKIAHRFMGIVLVLVVLHMLWIQSDISRYTPLRFWIFGLTVLAMISVTYRYIFYDLLPRKLVFKVDTITPFGNVTEIILSTQKDRLIYKPGQFVFVKFNSKDLIRQNHPFSISSFTDGRQLRLSIKNLGDFTSQLGKVRTGDKVEVYGPYGRFFVDNNTNKDLVFIAGGIGVTPILSITQSLAKLRLQKKVFTFYLVATKNDLYREEELSGAHIDKYKYSQWISAEKGTLKVENIASEIGNLNDKQFYICGPLEMMKAMSQQLVGKGIDKNDIFFEDFSLR